MSLATYLTSGAASAAALLSATSLVLTRRWQQRDLLMRRTWEERDVEEQRRSAMRVWTLDSLKQPLIDHINMSFRLGRVCREGQIALAKGDAESRESAFSRTVDLHIKYMDEMLYLRLLGTPKLVASAEHLHQCIDLLIDLTFAEDIKASGRPHFSKAGVPDGLTTARARSDCMSAREDLINRARQHIDLPPDAVIDRKFDDI